ncbi:MAG: 50S ribosomal protein L2 [Candidatus Ranarchaeia archaeon]
MGKRILVQRRGRGSPTFRAPTHRRKGKAKHPPMYKDKLIGVINDIIHDPGRGAPLARIKYNDNSVGHNIAVEGVYVGQIIESGQSVSPSVGNVLPLENIPDGTFVCNIEQVPGDGGRFARSSGNFGIIRTHGDKVAMIKMPSGEEKRFNNKCRAIVGVVAGGGRPEKPFLKAGSKFYSVRAKAKRWPVVRGVAMNAVYHPHGGGAKQHSLKPITVSRNAPPGAKVGLIAAKRTGRGRRK